MLVLRPGNNWNFAYSKWKFIKAKIIHCPIFKDVCETVIFMQLRKTFTAACKIFKISQKFIFRETDAILFWDLHFMISDFSIHKTFKLIAFLSERAHFRRGIERAFALALQFELKKLCEKNSSRQKHFFSRSGIKIVIFRQKNCEGINWCTERNFVNSLLLVVWSECAT